MLQIRLNLHRIQFFPHTESRQTVQERIYAMKPVFELCAGSYEDCLSAQKYGASRIELNSALSLGGLTPSETLLRRVKENCSLPVICMVRPREGGFFYSSDEIILMFEQAENLLLAGADGIAFGFLNEDRTINEEETRRMIDLIHVFGKQAVFHRAIDVCQNYEEAIKCLIRLGADRILTSGQRSSAIDGTERLKEIQEKYGQQIEILPGAGISDQNAVQLLEDTGLHQVHASCKGYICDPTTRAGEVSYSAYPGEYASCFMQADPEKIQKLAGALSEYSSAQQGSKSDQNQ